MIAALKVLAAVGLGPSVGCRKFICGDVRPAMPAGSEQNVLGLSHPQGYGWLVRKLAPQTASSLAAPPNNPQTLVR